MQIRKQGLADSAALTGAVQRQALDQASTPSMEDMAQALERTGDYRVLRKLRPRTDFAGADGSAAGCVRTLALLDVETTGLDVEHDEIIELAMIKAEYVTDGRLRRVTDTFAAFNESSAPLAPHIVRLTGITDVMLAGRKFDSPAVERFVADVDLVIAHNARFDRGFAERYWPAFEHIAWACTVTQLDWGALGFDGARLSQLLSSIGLFHGAHRALDDCWALLELLAYRPATAPTSVLGMLLDTARKPTRRIFAEHAPYDQKDRLRARGFRWNPGTDGRPRAWHREVEESALSAELEYLNTEIYGRPVELLVQPVTAWSRFSARTG